MLFSELYKSMVNKTTFVLLIGGDRPNRPMDLPLNSCHIAEVVQGMDDGPVT